MMQGPDGVKLKLPAMAPAMNPFDMQGAGLSLGR